MTEKITTVLSLATGVGVGLWGLSVNEWVAVGGFVLAFITVLINWHYKHKHYNLARSKKKEKKK